MYNNIIYNINEVMFSVHTMTSWDNDLSIDAEEKFPWDQKKKKKKKKKGAERMTQDTPAAATPEDCIS